jgi:hypothetical protein
MNSDLVPMGRPIPKSQIWVYAAVCDCLVLKVDTRKRSTINELNQVRGKRSRSPIPEWETLIIETRSFKLSYPMTMLHTRIYLDLFDRKWGDRYRDLSAGSINFSIAEGGEKDEAEWHKTVGFPGPKELLHDLSEVCQGNDTFVAVHELEDVVEFNIVQLPAIEIEHTILQLPPGDEARFLCVVN